ncbi:MAG: radical SAM/SPASM domain-containing protein [Cytophagales bacterium]
MPIITQDNIAVLRSLSARKALNIAVSFFTFHLSKLLKRPIVLSGPVSFSVEPTTSCNLRCPECPSGLRSFSRPTGMIDLKLYDKIINQLSKTAHYLTLYFQGEPFLHKDFLELVKLAKKKKLYVATSTNAHYIDKEMAEKIVLSGLDRLIISIDGLSQETYSQYRVGGKLNKVIEASRFMVEAKRTLKSKNPHLIFQFLVVKPNEHEVQGVFSLAKELGIDEVRLKTAQIYDFENGSDLMPTQEKYSRYKLGKEGKYILKNKLENQCWKMWQGCVLTWDGKVVPCCFDKDAHHSMGEMNKSDFHKIWKSNSYHDFRSKLLKSRAEIDICKNCSEGTKVFEE